MRIRTMPKRINIPAIEDGWDDYKEEFINLPAVSFSIEHSLISISKWEEKWCIPFLKKTQEKTAEQMLDYIRCMTLTPNVNLDVYYRLTSDMIKDIYAYIEEPHSAIIFGVDPLMEKREGAAPSREVITSELIYYWMFSYQIPMECQKWHLNRLLNLIRIFSEKQKQADPKNRMSKREIMTRNAKLNAARRKKLHSKG